MIHLPGLTNLLYTILLAVLYTLIHAILCTSAYLAYLDLAEHLNFFPLNYFLNIVMYNMLHIVSSKKFHRISSSPSSSYPF